ncbi:uncharacterized protein KY384_006919 [Bacidia gigantensis]|uniref:uncharacterized protein n=1 Tax=Bacidia gigantensis TaxID=2732470 RepID=UPI001D046CC1|nr:uncharacterized protein KY384_006919 [Bacidia gigantensis]KAG8528003.1 hypothetical protein KY384_006919 [Bacidia gigantensis]
MSSLLSKLSPAAGKQQVGRAVAGQAVRTRPYSSFYPTMRVEKKVSAPQRSLNTTKHLNTIHDESTIDFAYMPQDILSDPAESETFRVPLLPDNYSPPLEHTNNAHHDFHMESVVKPTISTTSANGTHIDNPSAMSDVTDNHALDLKDNVYDLTKKVTNAAASKIQNVKEMNMQTEGEERGLVGGIVNGLIDEIFGPKRVARLYY